MIQQMPSRPGALPRLLADRASAAEIAEHLDSLSGTRRVAEAIALQGKQVGHLYDAVGGSEPLTVEDFVPPDASTHATFIFEGRNSAPAFSRFQKRFARLPDGLVIGHNEQLWSFLSGPGYFVLRPPAADAPAPDELYFDYTSPPGRAPTGWPRYRPNTWGPSLLIYGHMKDYMRRVARGVVVGKAYKHDAFAGFYFLLARAD